MVAILALHFSDSPLPDNGDPRIFLIRSAAMPRIPPKRKLGQARGPRILNGAAMDVKTAASELGANEKFLRGKIERKEIPFRKWGGRIVILRADLERYLNNLPGVSTEEALKKANKELNA
jgi:excisionase family DNA binding protein